jgi:acetyltransferase-like isoleucine patch superfamily enzyme
VLGAECFVSTLASVHADTLHLGDRSYIAASAYITDDVRLGADCTVNPFTVVRGRVRGGDGVRIGAHTSILGFNHSMAAHEPVFRQPLVSAGIEIGDDVWIGSNVVILDGVSIGSHAVVGAGAVVTKDVEDGAIVVGNPARRVRWRVEPDDADSGAASTSGAATSAAGTSVAANSTAARRTAELRERVAAFADRAREETPAILARSWHDGAGMFVDRPGAAPTVRAQCDAIELADLLLGRAPEQLPVHAQRDRLLGWQDATSGLVASLGSDLQPVDEPDPTDGDVLYHVECVGYALDILGAGFAHPVSLITSGSADTVIRLLDELPWRDRAWGAGHVVDALGTALLWTRRRGDEVRSGVTEALFGWLVTHADAGTGMWGAPTAAEGLLQPVNGFYRASRGTFAQFGIDVPDARAVVDTVLRHSDDARFFSRHRQNACNVLDVAHPLWLTRSSGYRRGEATAVAAHLLEDALSRWTPGAGIGFRVGGAAAAGQPDAQPGLQGTEMWLATIWYLADLVGVSDALGYRPRGIHRPEPALAL